MDGPDQVSLHTMNAFRFLERLPSTSCDGNGQEATFLGRYNSEWETLWVVDGPDQVNFQFTSKYQCLALLGLP